MKTIKNKPNRSSHSDLNHSEKKQLLKTRKGHISSRRDTTKIYSTQGSKPGPRV